MGANALAVSGTNLFAGTEFNGVFLSADNGTSWTAVNGGLTCLNVEALAVSPNGAGGTNLFVGTDPGGVFLSTNNGTSWSAVNTGLTNTSVYSFAVSTNVAGDTNLFAGTQGGGVFLSTDNGTSWTAIGLTNIPVYALAVSPNGAGGTNLFAGGVGGIYLSTNNGASWTQVHAGWEGAWALAIAFIDTKLFIATRGYGVYLSPDNGTSWTQVNSGLTNPYVFALAVSGANLFAGTSGGGVFLSTNDGTSWTAINTGLTYPSIGALAVPPNGAGGPNLFGGGQYNSGGVWRLDLLDIGLAVAATNFKAVATNGSVVLTWQTQSEVNNLGFNIIRKDAGTGVSSLIASYTSDISLCGLGTSTTGKSYTYKDVHIVNGHTYEYTVESVASDGTKKDYPPIQVIVNTPKDYALYQNYPDPFNPTTTIRFDLKQTSTVVLDVFNTIGQKIMEQSYGTLNAGEYEKELSMAQFASGVYYYRIEAVGNDGEHFVSIKKLVLMK
jgi:photosystem II stability/assembly factor-like uncharacterized protein